VGGELNAVDFSFDALAREVDAFDIVKAAFRGDGFDTEMDAARAESFDVGDTAVAGDTFDIELFAFGREGFDIIDGAVFADGFYGSQLVSANKDLHREPFPVHEGFDVEKVGVAIGFDGFDGVDFSGLVDGLHVKEAAFGMDGFDVPDFFISGAAGAEEGTEEYGEESGKKRAAKSFHKKC
jgi:hypothetical protein